MGPKPKVKAKVPRLTKEELTETIDIALSTKNPYMSENCVAFDRKDQAYKPISEYLEPLTVLNIQGTMRRKMSEGVEILFEEKKEEKKKENKFNFQSVETQTPLLHETEQGNQIDASLFPVLKFRATASKAEIFSAYEKHEKKKKENNPYSWISRALKNIRHYIGKKPSPLQDYNRKFLRLCERMVDQNLSEANLDYSYYDDPNDEFRPQSGSLLPLWRFSCSLIKDIPVTDIRWSVHFDDLFGVSYRTLKAEESDEEDLGMIRESGILCIYSLKGPNYPEKIIQCPVAVCCLTFHPDSPYLLAAGCESGILHVYDLRRELNEPSGTNKTTEKILHCDTVNKLNWLPDVLPQKLCAVSTDGNVLSWQYLLNDLSLSDDVTSLQIKDWTGEVPPRGIETETESTMDKILRPEVGVRMAAKSMSLNPSEKDFFIVGTETGVILKCSFDEKRQLDCYEDHKRTVSRVQWNPYHPRVFLSCSDDMTVRIWDHTMKESVFEFFNDSGMKDACWAPFSSTLFAALSGTALLYVYDLAVDKEKAIGTYEVYTAKEGISLTTVCFHPTKPVLLIGDEKGYVLSFKLSPNLRSSLQALETMDKDKFIEGEIEKMEKLLATAKDKIKHT